MPSIQLPQRPAFCRSFNSSLIASTYQLDGDSRDGALHFLRPDDLSTENVVKTTAGVFRFEIVDGEKLVAALTDGTLALISLSDYSTQSIPVSDDMLLNVSVKGDRALVSTKNGGVSLVDLGSGDVRHQWLAHKLPFTHEPCEVWATALSENRAATGGDDGLLRIWDLHGAHMSTAKAFEAGVTYVEWVDENTLLTGSYDQHIRTFDIRKVYMPVTDTKTDGGVWHIETRLVDDKKQYLAACMYGGWALYDEQWDLLEKNEDVGTEGLLYGVTFLDDSNIAFTTFNDYRVSTAALTV